METKEYNLKDNDNLEIIDSNKIIIINISPNSNVSIQERVNTDSKIIINAKDYSTINYRAVLFGNIKIERTMNLGKNIDLNIETISLNQLEDTTIIEMNDINSNVVYKNLCIANELNQVINTKINHNASKTVSSINNIGVTINNANILFDTTGFVENGYKECDCRQLSKGIIIGEKSKITSRPILLINEYDVKAYHGATIGKMSDDELFYLMSRGLSKKEAFMLILDGLISPFLNDIKNEELKTQISEKISKLIGD